MKKQIVIIHGGSSFKTYKDYIQNLKKQEISIENLKFQKRWKDGLSAELGDDYEFLTPRMPNRENARYEEWKIWFNRIEKILDDEVILIGHSLGGSFLTKYLSKNTFSKN